MYLLLFGFLLVYSGQFSSVIIFYKTNYRYMIKHAGFQFTPNHIGVKKPFNCNGGWALFLFALPILFFIFWIETYAIVMTKAVSNMDIVLMKTVILW